MQKIFMQFKEKAASFTPKAAMANCANFTNADQVRAQGAEGPYLWGCVGMQLLVPCLQEVALNALQAAWQLIICRQVSHCNSMQQPN